MQQKLTLLIDKNGKVTMDVNGVQGTACKDFTKAHEALLAGGAPPVILEKPEMHMQADVSNTVSMGY